MSDITYSAIIHPIDPSPRRRLMEIGLDSIKTRRLLNFDDTSGNKPILAKLESNLREIESIENRLRSAGVQVTRAEILPIATGA